MNPNLAWHAILLTSEPSGQEGAWYSKPFHLNQLNDFLLEYDPQHSQIWLSVYFYDCHC